MIDPAMKVRDVALIPEATRILENLKIDYCCGGERPLAEACELAGIQLEDLQEILEAAQENSGQSRDTDFKTMPLSDLITYIIYKHHVFTTNEMARLEALTAKVIAVHGKNHPELTEVATLLDVLFAELRPHMFKEEHVLFPFVCELEQSMLRKGLPPFPPFGTVNNPIRMMMVEHDNAGALLKEIRRLTSDYSAPGDACISYQTLYQALEEFEQDLHQHIHLENNILFPKASEIEHSYRSR